MTWIITRELNLFCNPEEIFDFFWANLFALESFKVIHCSVINVLCCFQQLWYIIIIICACQQLFSFCFASFPKQLVVTCLRQPVNNTKLSFVCQQLFSSFYSMNVRITYPDSLPIHLNIDVHHKYLPCGEYYTNIIFFGCQHTFFIFYTYILLKFRKWTPHALKGQKLLAQGSALGNYGHKLVAL